MIKVVENVLAKFVNILIMILKKGVGIFANLLKMETEMFIAFIFTCLSLLVVVDKLSDLVIIFLTAVPKSNVNIIFSIITLLFPVIAYLNIIESELVTHYKIKQKYLEIFAMLFILIFSLNIAIYLNYISWYLFFKLPNFLNILKTEATSIKTAFSVPTIIVFVISYRFLTSKLNLIIRRGDEKEE